MGTTLLGFILSILFHYPLAIGFLPGLFLLYYQALRKDVPLSDLLKTSFRGIGKTKEILWLFVFIGILLPAWYYSGTIPDMVAFMLSWIRPEHFFVLAFLITLIISMMLGTGVGSLSVIGIPLFSTGDALGLPASWVAGALISGAFVGDRTSPVSSVHQLLAHSLEISPVKKQLRYLLPTTVFAVVFSILFYAGADYFLSRQTNNVITSAKQIEPISWLSFIPPVALIMTVMLGWKIRYCFFVSTALASLLALFNGITLSTLLPAMWTGVEGLGGLSNMLMLMVFIALVGMYSQILEEGKIVQPFIDKMLTDKTSLSKNTNQTVGIATMISILAPNQAFPIILTSRVLLPHWQVNFSKGQLARIVADTTMVFAGLIPWSLMAIICSTILNVGVLTYAPFASFLWSLPFFTILYSRIQEKRMKTFTRGA